MTQEQKQFLLSLLSGIQIKAVDKEALKNVEMIQSITAFLITPDDNPEK